MIRSVVFDLDDTLFPEHQYVMSGFHAVDEHVAKKYGRAGFFEHAHRLFSGGHRGNIFNLALERLEIVPESSLITELLGIYRDHDPAIELYEDARWSIDFFGKTHKLGILTDGYLATQRNKVRALGVAPRFDIVVYSDEYGRENWKPSPLPYEKVMNFLHCSGQECVYIADNPEKDFITARRLGWRTIRISRETSEYSQLKAQPGYEADSKILSLFELEGLIP
jgi:putative hydrolase of the HAD superfamily